MSFIIGQKSRHCFHNVFWSLPLQVCRSFGLLRRKRQDTRHFSIILRLMRDLYQKVRAISNPPKNPLKIPKWFSLGGLRIQACRLDLDGSMLLCSVVDVCDFQGAKHFLIFFENTKGFRCSGTLIGSINPFFWKSHTMFFFQNIYVQKIAWKKPWRIAFWSFKSEPKDIIGSSQVAAILYALTALKVMNALPLPGELSKKTVGFYLWFPRWCVVFRRVYLEVKSRKKRRSCSTGAFEKVPQKIGEVGFFVCQSFTVNSFWGSSTEAKLERLLRWWSEPGSDFVWNWRPK